MARRDRFLGVSVAAAGLLLAGAWVGCGGSESGGNDTTDSGSIEDSGVVVDTAKPDTTPADTAPEVAPDTAPTYDAPGSLFDVTIPDVEFDGDVSAAGCYDCALASCHDQVAACDKDVQCRGLLLCVLVDCGGSTTDLGCVATCGLEYDVTSFTSPVATEALAIFTCTQSKCAGACPAVSLDGGGPGDATPTDAGSSESDSSEAGSAEVGPGAEAGPMTHVPEWEKSRAVDPALVDALGALKASFESMPEVRDGLVDHLRSAR